MASSGDPPHPCERRLVCRSGREELRQPILENIHHARISLAHQEMIGVGDQMQLRWLFRMTEEVDGLLGGRHGIHGRVQQQQRAEEEVPGTNGREPLKRLLKRLGSLLRPYCIALTESLTDSHSSY